MVVAPTSAPITHAQRVARGRNAAKATAAREEARSAEREAVSTELASLKIPVAAVSEARMMAAKAAVAEMDLAERRGELIAVEKARADVLDKFATVRTRILGVPSRVAQRLPKLATEVVPVLEELLREALLELADGVE
jgi:phage terminase Nu1 subunit (DNA packaging protein)